MSFITTAAEDYKVAAHDSGETVTFVSVNGTSTTSYTVAFAVGADLAAEEIASGGGQWEMGDRRWLLGREQITDADHYPKPGDRLTDSDGVVWEIQTATLDSLKVSFEVVTRKRK